MNEVVETDVALVGYGPTGSMLANMLGARGWKVDAFERAPDVFHQPRAVHMDAEIMRVFQQAGLAEAIRPAITPVRGMHLLNAAGTMIFRYDAGEGPGPLGWPDGFMFYQPDLERALRQGARRFDNVTAHLEHEVRAVRSTGEGAVLDVDDARGTRKTVRARFAVGCCGARSITRAALGSALFDYGFEQPWLVLDIVQRHDAGLPDVTVQYCETERPATYVVMPGARRRFEIMLMPGDTPETVTSAHRIAELLGRWIDPSAYDVERAAVYAFHCLVAEKWRDGPLMIAGDAVHQMPPFLGQGMCSGIRDAATLSWTLDLVLRGAARPSLLDTYQEEREPHVRQIIETDMYLGALIQTTDPEVARQRDAHALAGGGPSTLTPPDYPLGGSLCGSRPADRLPFPQPILEDGRMHDEVLGAGFALVGSVAPSPRARRILDALGAVTVDSPAPPIAAWLAAQGASAAIVRPDRNVLAAVDDAQGLDAALGPLAAHLTAVS
jgi:3-(3-hydroxy-phenyl)propionate hydroxylase